MAVEDHGAGTQYVRVGWWPRTRPVGAFLIVLFAALVGAILVLVVGGLWRRSKLALHAEKTAAAE